jgi:hypothetical protein
MNSNITYLLDLLDDESQQSATLAMIELLKYDSEIGEALQGLQESSNSRVRRRVHQLQNILSIRARRRNIITRLKNGQNDIFMGALDLHFQWYDNDSEELILKLWKNISKEAESYSPNTLNKLAHFMKQYGFTSSPNGDIEADYYCLGVVFEELVGSDLLLCIMGQKLANQWKEELNIIQVMGDFALINKEGHVLFPKREWHILSRVKQRNYQVWSSEQLLRYLASMLFLCAVGTDSFRYVQTLGTCLARLSHLDSLEELPYPYGMKLS